MLLLYNGTEGVPGWGFRSSDPVLKAWWELRVKAAETSLVLQSSLGTHGGAEQGDWFQDALRYHNSGMLKFLI